MKFCHFRDDFAVRRQGVPVLSAQFVRVPVYIRGALRTTRPTSLVPAMPTWGQTRPTLKFIRGAVHNTIWRRLARISVFITALGLASSGLALERWFYVSQNLWVDQNITNLVA